MNLARLTRPWWTHLAVVTVLVLGLLYADQAVGPPRSGMDKYLFHLKVGLAPAMRLTGVLRTMQLPPLSTADMERLMFPLLSARQKQILEDTGGNQLQDTGQ